MHQLSEKWAIFWCDLLKSIIFEEIEEEGIHQFLQKTAETGRCQERCRFFTT